MESLHFCVNFVVQSPWLENVDMKKIDWELRESMAVWTKHTYGSYTRWTDRKVSGQCSDRNSEAAGESIQCL